MYRFICLGDKISANEIIIDDPSQVHHIRDVLRLAEKEKLIICDNLGREYQCLIQRLEKGRIILSIEHKKLPQKTIGIKTAFAVAIPKKSKMEDIIDKLTQLGADRIIPLETERVIVRIEKGKQITRQQRWEKRALAAAQQSQRNTLPVIEPIKKISQVLQESAGFDLKLIPSLCVKTKPLDEVLRETKFKSILVFIGPEGDFTPQEVEEANKAGCISVSLGEQVLRVETAAIYVASVIKYLGEAER